MEARGIKDIQPELTVEPILQRSLDLRYKGQSFTLNIPCSIDLKNIEQTFHQLHKKTYGHALDMQIELVNLRVNITGSVPPFKLPVVTSKNSKFVEPKKINCFGVDQPVLVYQRKELKSRQTIIGPALILETVSTTLIDSDWRCLVDDWGNFLLTRE